MAAYAIERDPILADERADTLAKRVEVVLHTLAATTGTPCARCGTSVCAHDALASLVLGFQREPRCTSCLGEETTRGANLLRDQLTSFVLSKDCLTVGWRWATAREPQCAWSSPEPAQRDDTSMRGADRLGPEFAVEPTHDAEWNAGDLACGELVLELRRRLRAMAPGSVIKVTSHDSAAPEDMPAWCRLTGHPLAYAKHPIYFIRRKED